MQLNATQRVQPRLLRREERTPVQIRASLYYATTFEPAIICDISRHGAGIEGCRSVMPGDEVTIKFLDGRKLTARVRWWLAGRCGVLFDVPLEPDDRLLRDDPAVLAPSKAR